jgi:hypothetical protein
MLPKQRDEVTALDDHQLAIFDCHRIGGPLSFIEKGNLSEDFAGND